MVSKESDKGDLAAAEARFRLTRLGFKIANPESHDLPYDLIIDSTFTNFVMTRLLRVQVKFSAADIVDLRGYKNERYPQDSFDMLYVWYAPEERAHMLPNFTANSGITVNTIPTVCQWVSRLPRKVDLEEKMDGWASGLSRQPGKLVYPERGIVSSNLTSSAILNLFPPETTANLCLEQVGPVGISRQGLG